MAELKQLSSITFYQGWYGTCSETGDNECADFPLIEGELADAIKLYDEILAVYEIRSDAEGTISYNGDLADGFPLHYSNTELRSLKCGKCYRILLKPGAGKITIPEFTYANEANDDPEQSINNRITDNCSIPVAEFEFDAVTSITDELDEGYINSDATITMKKPIQISSQVQKEFLNLKLNPREVDFNIDYLVKLIHGLILQQPK